MMNNRVIIGPYRYIHTTDGYTCTYHIIWGPPCTSLTSSPLCLLTNQGPSPLIIAPNQTTKQSPPAFVFGCYSFPDKSVFAFPGFIHDEWWFGSSPLDNKQQQQEINNLNIINNNKSFSSLSSPRSCATEDNHHLTS